MLYKFFCWITGKSHLDSTTYYLTRYNPSTKVWEYQDHGSYEMMCEIKKRLEKRTNYKYKITTDIPHQFPY